MAKDGKRQAEEQEQQSVNVDKRGDGDSQSSRGSGGNGPTDELGNGSGGRVLCGCLERGAGNARIQARPPLPARGQILRADLGSKSP